MRGTYQLHQLQLQIYFRYWCTLRYDDFVNAIPKDEPRYCVVDFEYTTEDGRKQEKLVFVFW